MAAPDRSWSWRPAGRAALSDEVAELRRPRRRPGRVRRERRVQAFNGSADRRRSSVNARSSWAVSSSWTRKGRGRRHHNTTPRSLAGSRIYDEDARRRRGPASARATVNSTFRGADGQGDVHARPAGRVARRRYGAVAGRGGDDERIALHLHCSALCALLSATAAGLRPQRLDPGNWVRLPSSRKKALMLNAPGAVRRLGHAAGTKDAQHRMNGWAADRTATGGIAGPRTLVGCCRRAATETAAGRPGR